MGNWFKKDFLLGIGVGCIISAFLVSIFGVGTISDEEVVARASKLGMVKQSQPSGQFQSSEESTGLFSEKEDTGGTSEKKDVVDPSEKDTVDQSEGSTGNPQPGSSENDNPVTAVITITDTMGSESVARALGKKEIIKDQDEFLTVVDNHNAHRILQTGTFEVPVGGDLEEILYILIGKKR